MRRIMVDIETLGLEPGCVILSIGAVEFDVNGYREPFYHNIDIESCQNAGLTIDAGTLQWWLEQDQEVQGVLTGGVELERALDEFTEYYQGAAEIWANSPSFDCEILDAAYKAVDEDAPWDYYDERCFRTLRSLPLITEKPQRGNEHDALDDARYQADIASKRLEIIND